MFNITASVDFTVASVRWQVIGIDRHTIFDITVVVMRVMSSAVGKVLVI